MSILNFGKTNQDSLSAGVPAATITMSSQPIIPQYIGTPPIAQLVPEDQKEASKDDPEALKRKEFVSSLLSVAAPGVVISDHPGAGPTPVVAGAQTSQTVIDTKIDTNAKSPDTAASDANKKNEKTKEDVQNAKVDAANADLSKPKEAAQAPTDLKNIIVTPGSQPPPGSGTTKDPVASPEITRQQLLDLMTHLTARSNKCLAVAQNKAKELKSPEVDSEHLLAGLLTDSGVLKILTEMKVDIKKVEQDLTAVYKRGEQATNPQLSARLKRLLDVSLKSARSIGLEFIAPEHLLLGLFEDGEAVGARTLANNGLTKEELTKKIMGDQAKKADPNDPNAPTAAKEEQPKSALAQFTIDMTAKAQRGELDPVVERSEEIERVMHVLSRRTKNNPALVGEPGVGKTAVVEGLAQRIASGQVPEPLMGKKVLELDLMGILAGASHRGEFEQRMKDLIDEVVNSHGGIILFIDEMHTIVGAGGSGDGSSDAANFLKPALARGDLQVIGATTITEYRKYIEKDPALERRFQTVTVDEPTEEAAIKMLTALAPKYAEYHKVQIPPVAIEAAVKLSKRYVGDRFLPDKAIDLIDEAASSIRLPMISLPEDINSLESRISDLKTQVSTAEQNGDTVKAKGIATKIAELEPIIEEKRQLLAKKQGQSTVDVTEESIKEVVSRWTGIPLAKLSGSESEKLTQLEKIMHQRMIGQERPVKAVAAAVRRGRAGLKSNKRPIGSFIFLGPSGVGKTELTKTLAEILFGQEESMIRFDMTEFMEKHEVAKLLGPPPGYVGYEEGGKLTEAVRRKPYSVVLFDEIEKAHPDIFNILLQVLDDGRLTDNKGRTISFKNTVVICTSNIGTQLIQDHLLEKAKQSKDQKEDDGIEIETEAGAQSEKEVPFPDDPSREYTDMHMDAIDPAYKNAKQNLEVPELPSGFRYEDEVTKGMSSDEYAELKSLVMGELRKFFRPELINRFDEVIVFEPLQLSHMKKIVDLQIKQLMKVLAEQNLAINLSDEAKEHIVLEGFDPVYGARPLRRAIQQILENPISEMIIAQKVKEGDTIHTNFVDEDFVFTTEHPVKPEPMSTTQNDHEKSHVDGVTQAHNKTGEPQVYEKKHSFVCESSGYLFDTVTAAHSTVICPVDVRSRVHAISEANIQQSSLVTDQKESKVTEDGIHETTSPIQTINNARAATVDIPVRENINGIPSETHVPATQDTAVDATVQDVYHQTFAQA